VPPDSSPNDKPTGSRLGWRLRATRMLYESRWFNLRQDDLTLPGGEDIVFTYVDSPGFVSVVPITPSGEVVLIREYRYTIDRWVWAVPAGGLGSKAGTEPGDAAREELAEETGYVVDGELRHVASYYACVGNASSRAHVYLATDVRPATEQELDQTEMIEIRVVPLEAALEMARSGEIEDGNSQLALLLCEPLLAAGRDAGQEAGSDVGREVDRDVGREVDRDVDRDVGREE